MRLRRTLTATAAVAATAVVLAACAPPADDNTDGDATTAPDDSSVSQSIAFSVGPNDFGSYNGRTPETYSTYNSAVVDRLFAGFSYVDENGEIQQNSDLGSYELVSEEPMVVEYTINDNAVWSDGTPITVADAVFAWGTQNANLVNGDAPLFDSVSIDLGDTVPAGPQGDADGKTFTVEFANPDPDYQLQTWLAEPAHIVAEQGGLTTEELVEAIRSGDAASLVEAASFWNTGWSTPSGTLPDAALTPSSGPYVLSSWESGQSVTVKANENYYGEKFAPQNDELVIRFVDQDAMVQALQNGDLDVIGPQPTVDTVSQLEALGDDVNIVTGETLTWEHLDFNFREGSAFKDNLELRKAFALCVPRQQIVDNLIKPINEDTVVMNAREVFPFQSNYDEVVSAAYDGAYDEVDIDAAKAIVEEQGATGQEIRIGYAGGNARRADEVSLIKSSCDQAGFNIVDVSDANFMGEGGGLELGEYDAALFAWAGSGQITSGQNIYATGKPQNYGEFSNAEVDAAWTTLVSTLDTDVHLEQTKVIEKLLWDNLFGIPIFAHPGVDAAASDINNVTHTAAQTGIAWNAEAWNRAE